MGESADINRVDQSVILTLRAGVLTTEVGDELVLLNTANETYLEMNRSGRAMLEVASTHGDLVEALAELQRRFPDAEAATLRSDFSQFLDAVTSAGLADRF